MANHRQTLTDTRFVRTNDATSKSFRKSLHEAAESNTLRAQKIRQVKVLLWWQLVFLPVNGQIVVVRTILFSAIFNFAFHLFQSLMLLFGSLQKSITAVCLFRRSLCETRWQYSSIYMIIINYLRKSFLSAAGFSSNDFVTKMTYHGRGKLLK